MIKYAELHNDTGTRRLTGSVFQIDHLDPDIPPIGGVYHPDPVRRHRHTLRLVFDMLCRFIARRPFPADAIILHDDRHTPLLRRLILVDPEPDISHPPFPVSKSM